MASRSSHRLSRNAINVEVAIPMASASVAGSPQGSCSVRPYARPTSVLSPEPRRYSMTSNVKSKAGMYARWPSGLARYLATYAPAAATERSRTRAMISASSIRSSSDGLPKYSRSTSGSLKALVMLRSRVLGSLKT